MLEAISRAKTIPQAWASLTDPVDSEEARTTPSTMRKGTTRSQDDVLFDSVCVVEDLPILPLPNSALSALPKPPSDQGFGLAADSRGI